MIKIKIVKADEELKLLCRWFNELPPEQLPKAPFFLDSGVQVSDGTLFYSQLRSETAAQEISGPRVITGSLKWTLQCLLEKVNHG